jgi:hypothetical protein
MSDYIFTKRKEAMMKVLEKKLRETLKDGKLVGSGMKPLARRILQEIKIPAKS